MNGRFQPLVNGATEFGPGQPGYLGGRWWEDTNSDGVQDSGDHYFLCPLLPPGRSTPLADAPGLRRWCRPRFLRTSCVRGERTVNRKPMDPDRRLYVAPWELRVGEMRVYYAVREAVRQVLVVAVGVKVRERLRIAGEDVEP